MPSVFMWVITMMIKDIKLLLKCQPLKCSMSIDETVTTPMGTMPCFNQGLLFIFNTLLLLRLVQCPNDRKK